MDETERSQIRQNFTKKVFSLGFVLITVGSHWRVFSITVLPIGWTTAEHKWRTRYKLGGYCDFLRKKQ